MMILTINLLQSITEPRPTEKPARYNWYHNSIVNIDEINVGRKEQKSNIKTVGRFMSITNTVITLSNNNALILWSKRSRRILNKLRAVIQVLKVLIGCLGCNIFSSSKSIYRSF
jgi:hypothetical protein